MARKILDLAGLDYYDGKIKEYIEAKAAEAAAGKITKELLESLPQSATGYSHDVIYLVPNSLGVSDNMYDEYVVVGSGSSEHFEKIGTTQADLNAKANADELIITPGTGADADKATIQLKEGTSVTVLTQHQSITGKANRASNPTAGHLASLTAEGHLADSGIDEDDVLQNSDISGIPTSDVDEMFPDDDDKGIPDQGDPQRIIFTIKMNDVSNFYNANNGANWNGWCVTGDNTLGLETAVRTLSGEDKRVVIKKTPQGIRDEEMLYKVVSNTAYLVYASDNIVASATYSIGRPAPSVDVNDDEPA